MYIKCYWSIVVLEGPVSHRMAAIKHHVGLLEEAVHEYTAVLATDGGYVPALKGVQVSF